PVHRRALAPFPTRRSSDLAGRFAAEACRLLRPREPRRAAARAREGRGREGKGRRSARQATARPGVQALQGRVHRQGAAWAAELRSEEHTLNSSHVKISYAV